MPGTWPDDDGATDDDGDAAPLAPPVHPDDRLWRHPSEVGWGVAPSASASAVHPAGSSGGGRTQALAPRLWALALTSGLTGAALALGLVALFAGIGTDTERVVERVGVRDRLADPLLAELSDGVVAVAEAVMPSVVRLEVETEDGASEGSGVVVLDDGHIITNAHVVEAATAITIVLADGRSIRGRLVGADALTDVAVVAPDGDDDEMTWIPAVRGPAGELEIGEPAVAVGSPLGLQGDPAVTLGVVSALGRRVSTSGGGLLHGMIQTDAPVADGSSGGALCDRSGRVVGITTTRFAGGTGAIGFATPMETAWAVAEALMADGIVHHVWLGIEGADLDATGSSILGIIGRGGGIVVDRVVPDSPADEAGIEAGDVLVAIDGERLSSMSDLVMALRGYQPGDEVTFELERDGEAGSAEVTLDERG